MQFPNGHLKHSASITANVKKMGGNLMLRPETWASPAMLTPKNSGDWRNVIDRQGHGASVEIF